ncbi:SDR family oxidoreductase [Brevundimonas sp. 3P9-tot-E]|uniref:SDR family NAD(P)-dependent oxidoreductase n=1 Tax=Brevundimonas TaxID=41275 RepID=UPI001905DA28|nr:MULTISPECIES: SDR family oxidoreductase [Brevundimonas]MDA0743338.1 SDR family oxidoreductase [Pseudomonadota bacterium]MBK1970746.1 SDR family oxidoreductase [Brevundimonas diminuta]MBK1976996.1 SDR family oxidoreductase [Brevundimonas diminuta]MDA1322290.1 SDR family oxidoreductase [Pseudomonadota bacterium]MDM8352432.1 SDR family oxidoreductase [Brevundimonas diminuta]
MGEGRRTVLITGASAGIGAALARVCAARGHDLILTARREGPLQALAGELAVAHGVAATVLVADLAEPEAPARLVEAIAARRLSVDGLINNAGFSRTTGFLTTDPDDHAAMIRVMLSAPVELSRLVLPGMVARGWGRVLNVASLAGQMPATGGDTLYGPIKSFLIKASQGLWLETQGTGVHVTALCPGYTYTEFHDVNGSRDQVSAAYPKWMWMDADRVARIGWDAVEANRPRVTPGVANNVLAALGGLLPDALALKMVGGHAKRLDRL